MYREARSHPNRRCDDSDCCNRRTPFSTVAPQVGSGTGLFVEQQVRIVQGILIKAASARVWQMPHRPVYRQDSKIVRKLIQG